MYDQTPVISVSAWSIYLDLAQDLILFVCLIVCLIVCLFVCLFNFVTQMFTPHLN